MKGLFLACAVVAAAEPLPQGLTLRVHATPDEATFHLALVVPLRHGLPAGVAATWARGLGVARVEEAGGTLRVQLEGHTDHLETVFQRLAQALLRPRLPDAAAHRAEMDHLPAGEAERQEARRRILGVLAGCPAAGVPDGEPSAVWGSALQPERAVLAVVGDVTSAQVRRLAWQYLGLWRSGTPLPPAEVRPQAGEAWVAALALPPGGPGRVVAGLLHAAEVDLPTGWTWSLGHDGGTGSFWVEARGGDGDPGAALEAWKRRALAPSAGHLATVRNRLASAWDDPGVRALGLALGEAPVPPVGELARMLGSVADRPFRMQRIP